MTADGFEADLAVKALARRLQDWGVDNPGSKARAFIDDLISRGWRPKLDAPQRRPPRADEECPRHPGEYAGPICRCCNADKKAARDAEAEQVAAHHARTQADHIAAARAAIRATQEDTHG